ncbi:acylphosphatase [Chloroflexota bacterium]
MQAVIHGRVQGVFCRSFVRQEAGKLGLTGYVRNVPDGTVAVCAEGEKINLEALIRQLRVGPVGARVERVETRWSEHTGKFDDFRINY